jgi:hypothetical protein
MAGWQSMAAFVVQFRETTDIGAGRIDGSVEHIASYQAARFHSGDELLAFMGRVLAEVRQAAGAADEEPPRS